MSKMVVTTLLHVDTSVKVNGKYYFDVLFPQQMLPAIRSVAGDTFMLSYHVQNVITLRLTAHVQLPQRETSDFIAADLWPLNSPDLNPVDHKIWSIHVSACIYETLINNVDEIKQRLIKVFSGLRQTLTQLLAWKRRLRICVRALKRHY